jgi:hypothetical protein
VSSGLAVVLRDRNAGLILSPRRSVRERPDRRAAARWQVAVAADAVLGAAIAVWVTAPPADLPMQKALDHGVVASVAAVWLTLRASVLVCPGWLAVPKADLIIGPIAVGMYWRHKRPECPSDGIT